MTAHEMFFVHHAVNDKDAWSKMFATMIGEYMDKTPEQAAENPSFKGNKSVLSLSNEDMSQTFCIWQCGKPMELADFQTFIDEIAPAATNTPHPIIQLIGGENLTFETYVKDMQKMGTDGKVQPYYGDGNLWFVRHGITDQAQWDTIMGEVFSSVKGLKTSDEVSKKWKVPQGVKGAFTAVFADDQGAFCLWDVPKDYNDKDFQEMIDNFTGPASKNGPVWKVNAENGVNSRVIHPDFWSKDAIANAE